MNKSTSYDISVVSGPLAERFVSIPTGPELLSRQLDEFRAGGLKGLARTMDVIEERDDLLSSVVPKAKAAPTVHGWEINTVQTHTKGEEEKAAEQKRRLEHFYNNLRATSAIERNLLGGTELLLEQMMDAKGKRYSVHNLVWKSLGSGLYTVTAHHVPLWFFESRTGELRFLDQPGKYDGVPMDRGAWMVTVGRGLMIACAVAWMYKRLSLRDWLIYCQRHGMPGFEGVTDAAEGSDDWMKLVKAVQAAAAGEFAWVRGMNQTINVVDFAAKGEIPYPGLVDRMDRAMSAIWRGGDLSTMSKDKQAVGAEGQAGEGDIIESKDAQWLSGQAGFQLDRLFLDYSFGEDEPALAYFTVKTSQKQDISLDLQIDGFALQNGHPISRKQFSERYNRPEPAAGDELLGAPEEEVDPKEKKTSAINEAGTISKALRRDSAGVTKLVGKLLAEKPDQFREAAERLRRMLPGLLPTIGSSAAGELEELLAASFVAGASGAASALNEFQEGQQPRHPAGSEKGGQFAPKLLSKERERELQDKLEARTMTDEEKAEFRAHLAARSSVDVGPKRENVSSWNHLEDEDLERAEKLDELIESFDIEDPQTWGLEGDDLLGTEAIYEAIYDEAIEVPDDKVNLYRDIVAEDLKAARARHRGWKAELESLWRKRNVPATNEGIARRLIRAFNDWRTQRRNSKGQWTATGLGLVREFTDAEMSHSIATVLTAADQGQRTSVSLGLVPKALSDRIQKETGLDVAEFEIRADTDFVLHAQRYHPNLTDADFQQIPTLLMQADTLGTSPTKSQKLPAVEFRKDMASRDWLLVGAQLNGKGQLNMVTLKKSAVK